MASAALRNENIQIGITKTEEFLRDLPRCFTFGTDSKLHHDPRKINVFSHKNDFFGDAYGEVLKVENLEEFRIVKQRLLKHPIYIRVHLERHVKQYRTRYITHADYVAVVNTKHPVINQQLQDMLEEAEELYENGKRFSLECNFGGAFKAWFKENYPCSYGSYIAKYSNFCITNFTQRSKLFTHPVACILCFPLCLIAAPTHCAYRAIFSNDKDLGVKSSVVYVRGTTPQERAAIRNILQAAYIQGLADSRAHSAAMLSTQVAANAGPPSYSNIETESEAASPPPYESVNKDHENSSSKPEEIQVVIDDEDLITA